MMLENKVAVVTGASRGIGRMIALSMAREGADIAVIDYGSEDAAAAVCKEIEALGRKAAPFSCNVADFEQTAAATEAVIQTFGKFDILVNNAGITRDKLVLQMEEADWDAVLAVNLKGVFNMIKHAYRPFMRQRSGRIINISSVTGMMGNVGQANYSAAKAGIIGLTKTTAKELAARGVTCNAIAPGFIETDMTRAMTESAREAILNQVPMKTMGQPQDVANLAVFLASDNARYITGEVIKVDGGLYA